MLPLYYLYKCSKSLLQNRVIGARDGDPYEVLTPYLYHSVGGSWAVGA